MALVALALAWVGISTLARLRFRTDHVDVVSANVGRAALTTRVVMIVLDGVRDDRFAATFPKTHAFAASRGVVCPAVTGPLTFTVTGVHTLGTGAYATMALLPQNFQAQPIREDSLPASLSRVGKRTVVVGERVWRDLFLQHISHAVTIRDLGPYADQKLPASEILGRALAEDRCELCVWHDPLIDKKAHLYGIYGAEYGAYAAGIDEQVSALATNADARTTWVITSDHGALDSGNHGGDQPQARASFFAAWGPGIAPGPCPGTMSQADVPTLTAVLLGAPIPAISEGVVPPVVALRDDDSRAKLDAELLAQKHALLGSLARARGQELTDAPGIVESLERIASLKQPSSLWLMFAVLPLLASALLLASSAGLRTAAIRSALSATVLAFVALQVLLAHFALPGVSLGAAAAMYAGSVLLLIIAAALLLRRQPAWAPPLLVLVASATLAVTEAHWVILVAPLGLVVTAWFCAPARLRVPAALLTAACCALVTGLGWSYTLDSTKDFRQGWSLLITVPAAALYGYFSTRRFELPHRALAIAAPALICLLAALVPVALSPYLPPLVAVAIYAARRSRVAAFAILSPVEGAIVALSALQMGALQYVFLLLLALIVPQALDAARLEQGLGAKLAPWLRGAALVAASYLFVVAEGNRISPSDIKVLNGFLGGALPLWLPLTGTMLCLYYSALPMLLVSSWLRRTSSEERVKGAVRCASLILAVKLLYLGINFAWGGMSQGSWAKQLVECLLAGAWLTSLLLIVESHRARVLVAAPQVALAASE